MNYKRDYYAPVRRIKIVLAPSAQGDSVIERGVQIFGERIARRCGAALTRREGNFTLTLSVDPTIGKQGFRITSSENAATIEGSCKLGVVYGLGKFIHTSGFTADGFHPSRWQGTSVPTSPFRTIQMDTHFCNFYHMAPKHELEEYVEDLVLWGINHFEVVFPLIDLKDWNDPEVDRITGQIKIIHDVANRMGVKFGMEIVPNQDFVVQNDAVKAELCEARPGGKNGHNICPNAPGAIEYILSTTYGEIFRHLKRNGVKLDFVCFWPYDEGGCGCEKCKPWGANGYIKACKAVLEDLKKESPDVEVILSTWMFDTYRTVVEETVGATEEWEAFAKVMENDHDWVDYLLADAHGDFPKYPLEHGAPGGLPMINYPEISMYKLHPWGVYGANPLPEHFENLWLQVKDHVQGGMAYSEGIFNDMDKVIVSQFYWDRDTTADATLREYISYEYSPAAYDEVREAIRLIEKNHETASYGVGGKIAKVGADMDDARKARQILREVDGKLDMWARKAWRWRILLIRGELDVLRFECTLAKKDSLTLQTNWTQVMKGCEAAKPFFTELTQIYHSNLDYDPKTHPHYHYVRPMVMDI